MASTTNEMSPLRDGSDDGHDDSQSPDGAHGELGVGQSDGTSDFETFWNISNTIQGLPILAVPYAVKTGGWLSVFTIIVVALLSWRTSLLLVNCLYDIDTDNRTYRVRRTYEDIGEAAFSSFGRHLVGALMVLELIWVSSIYPMLVGNILLNTFDVYLNSYVLLTLIGGIALVPNIVLKDLSQVAWTSIITVSCSILIIVVFIALGMSRLRTLDVASLRVVDLQAYPTALVVIVSCYLSQPFVPFIESTMKNPSRFRTLLAKSFLSMTLCTVVIGIVADITFYPETQEVITNNLPEGWFRVTINIAASVLAFTSYTLPIFTAFDVVENYVLLFFKVHLVDPKKYVSCPGTFVRFIIVFVTIAMAAFIPHFSYVLALVGGVTGATLEFILPPIFHYLLRCKYMTTMDKVLDLLTTVAGVIALVVGLIISSISLWRCLQEDMKF